ncbi:sodium/nucleoside cotransporter 2 isoform X1 [Atheta coriaria]|uniref:sodium/nucleoside cotransporter 2 isoform X1 n=1 Tax=Dalotia coriaria TaxID=877792 RepID=UPI0031F361A4
MVFFVAFTGYFIWACVHYGYKGGPFEYTWCDGFGFLCVLYFFIAFGYFYNYVWCPYIKKPFYNQIVDPTAKNLRQIFEQKLYRWISWIAVLAIIAAFVIYDTWEEPDRLVSAGGLVVFLILGFLLSNNRTKINWRTIFSGLVLQFIFGLFTLRWDTGRAMFQCAGDKVTIFLGYAVEGSKFVYGEYLVDDLKIFAFKAISTIYFLGFMINILYHLGIMQKIILNLGLLLQGVMGTSICESVNAAANIFLGQSEAPLLLKPYLKDLTGSELHSVMTNGFASVSGTVLAAYIDFGANAAHLITASVMAAPAGLMYSKLMLPEEEETVLNEETIGMAESEYSSVLDAASQGACQATQIVLGIIANLIAFIATVYFINGVLGWMGMLVGFTGPEEIWSVELLMGYIFMPVSFLLGVPWDECQTVGKLIGLKTMVNEFAAFQQFKDADISPRSRIITTFALCGFANPGSMGVMISALSTLIPHKTGLVTQHVVRAFVSGTIVCFTTACIAGMLSSTDSTI